jgi:hypothetical protein
MSRRTFLAGQDHALLRFGDVVDAEEEVAWWRRPGRATGVVVDHLRGGLLRGGNRGATLTAANVDERHGLSQGA